MPTPNEIKNFQYSESIPRRVWDERSQHEKWETNPVTSKKGGGAAGGTTGDENLLVTPRSSFEYHVLGTQTIVAPQSAVGGLDLGSMDQTADDGLEINTGVLSDNPHAYIVGTDAFFVRFRTSIVDVSGTDDFNMGFRKLEANQANVDDYADMAVFNIESGDIKIETIVGGATTSSTDTTDNWADGEEKFVEVQVDASGTATFLIDGSAPTTTATYQFTSGLTVIPFVYFLQDTDIAGAVPIQIEHGLLT